MQHEARSMKLAARSMQTNGGDARHRLPSPARIQHVTCTFLGVRCTRITWQDREAEVVGLSGSLSVECFRYRRSALLGLPRQCGALLCSVACGTCSVACGTYPVACGTYSVACGTYSVACGTCSVACGTCSVACGTCWSISVLPVPGSPLPHLHRNWAPIARAVVRVQDVDMGRDAVSRMVIDCLLADTRHRSRARAPCLVL